MKIIELLNKIANNEEVPEKIKYMGYIWSYEKKSKDYFNGSEKLFYFYTNNIILCLNDEVEILKDEEEIDIQSIEEVNHYNIVSAIKGKTEENIDNELKLNSLAINKLTKAVKQLEKKVNSIEQK